MDKWWISGGQLSAPSRITAVNHCIDIHTHSKPALRASFRKHKKVVHMVVHQLSTTYPHSKSFQKRRLDQCFQPSKSSYPPKTFTSITIIILYLYIIQILSIQIKKLIRGEVFFFRFFWYPVNTLIVILLIVVRNI